MNPLILPDSGSLKPEGARVIVALDFADAAATLQFVRRLTPDLCRLKIGKELFTAAGPALVETLVAQGFDVFLDLKYHDIPHTVAQACRAAAQLGVWMVDVHTLGGRRMMEAAAQALSGSLNPPLLIGVTVLTSMQASDLTEIGVQESPEQMVLRLAALAVDCGLDGVVCSAQEAMLLRRRLGDGVQLVTPGIRLADSALDDQRRIMTPQDALVSGSSFLVMGRPITQAADPVSVLQSIQSMAQKIRPQPEHPTQ